MKNSTDDPDTLKNLQDTPKMIYLVFLNSEDKKKSVCIYF
jgi:hypothetical protein